MSKGFPVDDIKLVNNYPKLEARPAVVARDHPALTGSMATKRLKRPHDSIQLGKLIVDIAPGQVEGEEPQAGKSEAAEARGKKGGSARARALSPEERAEIANVAAQSSLEGIASL